MDKYLIIGLTNCMNKRNSCLSADKKSHKVSIKQMPYVKSLVSATDTNKIEI